MYRRVTLGLMATLFALTVYRAATLSFTTDEAFSYRLYVGAQPFRLLREYDANLHLLHTFLVWASVKAFGLSELAFRLPSLAACGLYFAGVYRLCGIALGGGALFLVGGAVLTVNPLVLDHMAIGRGYGLALACFCWAFVAALRAVREPGAGLLGVAVWLALSVASNLTFLFPAAALAAMLILWRPRLPGLVSDLAGPATVFTFLLVVLPFSRIEPGQFYFGAESFTEMNQTLAEMSIGGRHLDAGWVNAGVVALLAATAAVAALWWRRGGALLLASGTFVLTAAGVAASRVVLGLPLPWGRTGLYFGFLAPLFVLAGIARTPGWTRRAGVAAMAVVALVMGIRMEPGLFQEWAFDASSRQIMTRIREREGGRRTVRVAASAPVDKTLGLYREMYGLDWVTEIGSDPSAPGYDYYVLRDGLRGRADLRTISPGSVGGTVLAVPADVE